MGRTPGASVDGCPRTSPRHGFVGRSAQLERFAAALRAIGEQRPATFVVAGEAGIGKTRLVEQWLAMTSAAGATSLLGHCVQLAHAAYPYAPIVEATRRLVRDRGQQDVRRLVGGGRSALAALVPELEPDVGVPRTPDGWGQGQLFEAVLGLLRGLSAAEPGGVVLAVEDLHWADRATLELLDYVVRNLSHTPAVVVLTRRDELSPDHPLRLWTAELVRVSGVERIDLEPLGRADTADLLAQLGDGPQPLALVEDIYRRSDGNAFLIEELFDAAHRGSGAIPPTLRDTVLGRVGALSAPARAVLDAVAVGGGRVSTPLLAAVLDVDQADLVGALAEAIAAHVLVAADDRFAVRHAAFAETIYDALLPPERVRLHRAFATAIAAEPGLAGVAYEAGLAAHWRGAGAVDAALPATIAAARAAERQHAPASALAWWNDALALTGDDPERGRRIGIDRVELLAGAAEAANRAGQLDLAVQLVSDALAAVDDATEPHRAGRLHERLGWYSSRRGDDDRARAAYEHAVALVPVVPPSAERARALTAMGRTLSREGRPDQARQWCSEAVACAVLAGAVPEEGYARHALAMATAATGQHGAAFDELVRAVMIAETTGDLAELAWTAMHLARVAADVGRLADAVDVLLDRAGHARRSGLERTYGGLLECIAAGLLTELGRWDDADALTSAVLERGASGLEVVALDVVRGTVAVGRGRFTDARDALGAARAVALGLRDGRVSGLVYSGLAELARWEGRLDDAAALADDGLDAVANTGDDDMTARLCAIVLRVAADRRARPSRRSREAIERDAAASARALDGVRRLAHQVGDGTAVGIAAAAAEAEAAATTEDGPERVRAWQDAVAAAKRLESPYQQAICRSNLAAALAAGGDRAEAAAEVERARTIAESLGAAPLVAQIDQLARNAQLARTSTGPAARPGIDLTARERDVLRLVAAGRTNRQVASSLYISEKTVAVHVSRILSKLGVSTRGEAAALVHERHIVV